MTVHDWNYTKGSSFKIKFTFTGINAPAYYTQESITVNVIPDSAERPAIKLNLEDNNLVTGSWNFHGLEASCTA